MERLFKANARVERCPPISTLMARLFPVAFLLPRHLLRLRHRLRTTYRDIDRRRAVDEEGVGTIDRTLHPQVEAEAARPGIPRPSCPAFEPARGGARGLLRGGSVGEVVDAEAEVQR